MEDCINFALEEKKVEFFDKSRLRITLIDAESNAGSSFHRVALLDILTCEILSNTLARENFNSIRRVKVLQGEDLSLLINLNFNHPEKY